MTELINLAQKWLDMIGKPDHYDYERRLRLIRKIETAEFVGELYEQANGPGTVQRTLLMLPKTINGKLPAVVVPFYYPDRMAGYDLDTLEPTDEPDIAMALQLVRRGYAVVSADAYHLTYREFELERRDFSRWRHAADSLLQDHPEWTGIGKLIADTQLLVDLLCADSRVDHDRIGIAGHSLGGKMALYTGCLDHRIKAMLCSDFGLEWDRSNWNEPWYWGDKLDALKAADMDHAELMRLGGMKPFVLIAGLYDNEDALDGIIRAGYSNPSQYLFINHASGHRPPIEALEQGYDFLQKSF
ncbi:alpha/beta hydrolase family protein [Paenibacillus oceani]|uniref:Acetylxylan esterase n=1 Tax=Paenibacillus oceani TaxID=2772510 RepID=A0A927CBB1_9BACL|nr:alpha/beta hydrolase family protein [Paenibacillus oceani]MBD2864899.1 acetylxylan esterase [Paenibacillus oceani]